MLKSRIAPGPRPTVAYCAGRKITVASLACSYCAHEVHAALRRSKRLSETLARFVAVADPQTPDPAPRSS
jgi:hypothetical protein